MDDALFAPEARRRSIAGWSPRAGPTRSATSIPTSRIYTFWDYLRNAFARERRASGSTICC